MDRQNLYRQLDSCPSNSLDEQDADMQELLQCLSQDTSAQVLRQRIQALDGLIRTAVHDVPIPSGLSDRILSQLAAQETAAGESVADKVEEPKAALADEAPTLSRRNWLRWASALAAGVGVTGAGVHWFLNRTPASITTEGIMDVALHGAFDQVLTMWDNTPPKRPFPPQFPLSRVNQRLVVSWSSMTFLHRSSVVYHLLHQGQQAALMVSPISGRPSLPAQLRLDPLRTFAADTNRTCTIWRGGDFLYTLLVVGTHQDLAKFIGWGTPPV